MNALPPPSIPDMSIFLLSAQTAVRSSSLAEAFHLIASKMVGGKGAVPSHQLAYTVKLVKIEGPSSRERGGIIYSSASPNTVGQWKPFNVPGSNTVVALGDTVRAAILGSCGLC